MNICYKFYKITENLLTNYNNTNNINNNKFNNINNNFINKNIYQKIKCYNCNLTKPINGWYYSINNNNNRYFYCTDKCYNNSKL